MLTRDSEKSLDAFHRALQRTDGFRFYVLAVPVEAHADVMRRLRAWAGHNGVPPLEFVEAPDVNDLLSRPAPARTPGAKPTGLVLTRAEQLLDTDAGRAAADINMARDRLAAQTGGPLVVVLPPSRFGDFARAAPDLFDVRAGSWTLEMEARPELRQVGDLGEYSLDEQPPDAADLQAWAELLRKQTERTGDDAMQPSRLVDAWLRVATGFDRLFNHGEALAAAETARALSERSGYVMGEALSLSLLAEIHRQARRFDEALRCAGLAAERFAAVGSVVGAADADFKRAHVLAGLGRLDDAAPLVARALEVFERENEQLGRANALALSADIARGRGRDDDAAEFSRRLSEQLTLVTSPALHVDFLLKAARSERTRNPARAKELATQALEEARALRNLNAEFHALEELADLAFEAGRYEESDALCRDASDLARRLGIWRAYARTLLLRGQIAFELGDAASSMVASVEAAKSFASVEDHRGAALAHLAVARVTSGREQAGHVSRAREHARQSGSDDLLALLDQPNPEPSDV